MAKKKQSVPEYGTVTRKGTLYYRTRITDADGKQVSLYATTCEELYEKQLEARRQVEEIIFHRKHPTVAEYCEKWLLMQSAKVSTATIKGYRQNMKNYVINSLGDMYMEEVTADDIRLALVPLSQKSKGLYDTVNMLIKCVFYSAERSQLITDNPCVGISAKGGKASKKKDALTDQQVAILLDTVKELPPYLFIMIGLYSGLRREEILALQWDCVFLDESTPYISVRRAWRAEHNRPVISKHGLDLGINFYDTAIAYQNGTSEQYVGKALRDFAKRDDYVIATKFTPRTQEEIDGGVSGQKHIENYLNQSLSNLGMDYVDLYIYHMWDYHTPMEEIMDGLNRVVKAGKARYIGISNCFAWQLAKANYYARENGMTEFISIQGHYNLIAREEEREMAPFRRGLTLYTI